MANNEGTPLHGDRSAWNTTDHAGEHARDINESALLRHLPSPTSSGNFAVDDGSNWQTKTEAEVLAQLSGKATATFDWNGQDVTTTGDISAAGLDLSGITDGNVPYMAAAGFADSPIQVSGTDVGIGGDVDLDNTTHANQAGIITKSGSRFIHNFSYGDNGTVTPIGRNVFLGLNAGNFTMGSTATSTSHASYNVGIGYSAFGSNTIGFQNVSIGAFSLNNNTEGDRNMALGYAALSQITTGDGNTGIGVDAGRYLDGGGNNQTADNSIYIGRSSRASADGNDNEIAIGYLVIGNGSNTVTFGNTSVTDNYFSGAINFTELSSDPANPDEGASVMWMSDGTGTGDDGDVLLKITAGGVTKTKTLADFSAL